MSKSKLISLSAGVVLATATACATLAPGGVGPADAGAHAAPGGDEPHALCAGSKAAIDVQIAPKGLLKSPDGEQLELSMTLSHELSSQASVGYTIEVLDPHGRPVLPPQKSPVTTAARATAVASTYTTPKGLPPGAYEIRVTGAAATAGGLSERSSARFFLRTDGRRVTLLDAEEFYLTSGANNSL